MNKRFIFLFKKIRAFTVIELLIGVSILGVIAAISVPIYTQYKLKINNAIAVTDIIDIQVAIESYFQANDVYTNSLADVNLRKISRICHETKKAGKYNKNISITKN